MAQQAGKAADRRQRILAGLLALVLLALPGAPFRHAAAAMAGPPQAALHPCGEHAAASPAQAAASARDDKEHGQPCDGTGCLPDLACCTAAQCPALAGATPPVTPVRPAMTGLAVPAAISATVRRGIDIPPALPPPRRA